MTNRIVLTNRACRLTGINAAAFALDLASVRQPFGCTWARWFTEPELAGGERTLASQIFTSWNPLTSWLRNVEALQNAT